MNKTKFIEQFALHNNKPIRDLTHFRMSCKPVSKNPLLILELGSAEASLQSCIQHYSVYINLTGCTLYIAHATD